MALISNSARYAGPDQGIDFTGPGHVFALTECVITVVQASGSGWPGQGAKLVYRMLNIPRGAPRPPSSYVYVTEDFTPRPGLRVGDHLTRTSWLGDATGSGRAPGIEVGFAQGPTGQAFGTIHDGKPGGPAPVWGQRMAQFVTALSGSLGAPPPAPSSGQRGAPTGAGGPTGTTAPPPAHAPAPTPPHEPPGAGLPPGVRIVGPTGPTPVPRVVSSPPLGQHDYSQKVQVTGKAASIAGQNFIHADVALQALLRAHRKL